MRSSRSICCRRVASVCGSSANHCRERVDRPERRQDEVRRRAEDPVDRQRCRVEQAQLQAVREHEREAERERQEHDERRVDRRQEVRGDAGAEEPMQQSRGVVTEEDGAIDVGELAVEEVPGAQERHQRLEVPVGEVRRVEAHERDGDRDRPAPRPALAAHGAHRLERGPSPRLSVAPRGSRCRWRRAARRPLRRARRTAPRRCRGRGTRRPACSQARTRRDDEHDGHGGRRGQRAPREASPRPARRSRGRSPPSGAHPRERGRDPDGEHGDRRRRRRRRGCSASRSTRSRRR